jgi:hypothetical protein
MYCENCGSCCAIASVLPNAKAISVIILFMCHVLGQKSWWPFGYNTYTGKRYREIRKTKSNTKLRKAKVYETQIVHHTYTAESADQESFWKVCSQRSGISSLQASS